MANVEATRRPVLAPAGSHLGYARYLLISVLFLVAYLAINVITNSRQFRESGITLWSPDNGLSLLLLIESTFFAPIVLLGAILSDILINNVGHSFYVVVASELALTWSYLFIAIVLRDVFQLRYSGDHLQKYDCGARGCARQRSRDGNIILHCIVFYGRDSLVAILRRRQRFLDRRHRRNDCRASSRNSNS